MRLTLILVLTLYNYLLYGQPTGGRYTFQFLSLPNSARLTSLGGNLISVQDDDVNLAWSNPASLNENTDGALTISHQFHFADIQHSYFAYGHLFKKWNLPAHIGINHFNYGDFRYGDEIGLQEGSFSASETALVLGASKNIQDKLHLGANLKNIFSSFETYNAYGLALDAGAIYQLDSAYSSIGLVVKNIGGELVSFNAEKALAPLDIQLAYTKRLRYLPFRFSILLNQLNRWNIRYDDPNANQNTGLFGQNKEESTFKKNTDNFFRHLGFNGEFLLGKSQNLRIRGGYNHIRRQELSVQSLRSMAGFSFGAGIKISYFKLDYGMAFHHLAGATHHMTLSTNLKSFRKM